MRDKSYLIVVGGIILLLQSVRTLTNALYFGGKWSEALLWGGCAVAVLMTYPVVWLCFRRCPDDAAGREVANKAVEAAPVPVKEVVLKTGFALLLTFACVDFCMRIGGELHTPIIPPSYQIGLRACGIVMAAGATWLVLNTFQTVARRRGKA